MTSQTSLFQIPGSGGLNPDTDSRVRKTLKHINVNLGLSPGGLVTAYGDIYNLITPHVRPWQTKFLYLLILFNIFYTPTGWA